MSDSLPIEITTEIISWLPPKSIATCTAVCKSWNSLIKSSAFVRHHLSRTIQSYRQNNVHILLIRERKAVFSLYRNNNYSALATDDQYVKLPYPLKNVDDFWQMFHSFGWHLRVAGTCNGVICLGAPQSDLLYDDPIIIWNPSVRKFVMSPMPSITTRSLCWQTHAVGHDLRNNDYKVLRILSHEREAKPDHRAEVYSLARGSWRILDGSVPCCCRLSRESIFVNGASHWIQGFGKCGEKREDEEEYVIVLFDMQTELFGEMQMPEALRKCDHNSSIYIAEYEECLALIQMGLDFLHVWVMKVYGVVESWTRLYVILGPVSIPSPLFGFSCELEVKLRPNGYEDHKQVLNSGRGRVTVFSHCKSTRRYAPFSEGYLLTNSFVESLVLFDQPDVISY